MKQKLQGLLTPNPLIWPLSPIGETRKIPWPQIQTPSQTLSQIKLFQIIIALLTSTNQELLQHTTNHLPNPLYRMSASAEVIHIDDTESLLAKSFICYTSYRSKASEIPQNVLNIISYNIIIRIVNDIMYNLFLHLLFRIHRIIPGFPLLESFALSEKNNFLLCFCSSGYIFALFSVLPLLEFYIICWLLYKFRLK